jgi:RecA-family ATPase
MQQENGAYKQIPPMHWIAKDFMGEGITMLSVRPKAGKSLLALQLAIAMAAGEPFRIGTTAPKRTDKL